MASSILEIGGLKPFDVHTDPNSVAVEWKRWLRSFQLYADGKGLIIVPDKDENKIQRRALLLHCAGPDVQDIFDVLPDTGEPKEYEKAEKALNDYFVTQVNIPYERHQFREMSQREDETIDQYAVRLKRKAEACNYGVQMNDQIRDQIISTCRSSELRRKLLEKGQALTLKELQDTARTFEAVKRQSRSMSSHFDQANVNRVVETQTSRSPYGRGRGASRQPKPENKKKEPQSGGGECYRCGRHGHFAKDQNCPAKNKTCNKCHQTGHFASVCKTDSGRDRGDGKVNLVESEESDDEYAFSVSSRESMERVDVTVGGHIISMIVDSGASVNVIDQKLWSELKEQRIKCKSSKSSKKLFAYGSTEPLNTLGTFTALTSVGQNSVDAEFIVLEGKGEPLLGKTTAMQLGVLKIGPDIRQVNQSDQLMSEYTELFHGVGKLKDYQLKLHIDPNVTPVAQPARRVPYALRDKVKDKIEELVEMDIIESVEGPTPWVSPVVVVPKQNGEIRLCVDMRRANEAIIRERHPIPTVDDVLHSLNQSTVFSKLDLKCGITRLS